MSGFGTKMAKLSVTNKKVDDGNYRKIDGVELSHFRDATKAYLELVKANIYKG